MSVPRDVLSILNRDSNESPSDVLHRLGNERNLNLNVNNYNKI